MAKRMERAILIAEDNVETLMSWDNDIREFNRDHGAATGIEFTAHVARTTSEALLILERVRINCAVVDLRLPVDEKQGRDADGATGNDILERLLLQTGVPAFVYSGHPGEASDLVKASHIKILQKKGGGGMQVLRLLADQEGLMSAMAQMRANVEREAAALFNKAIWPRWQDAWRAIKDDAVVAGIITRQVVAHIAEALSFPSQFHHPEEFYFVPSLSERLQTGDMVKLGDEVHVVVTPRCNLAHKYPKHIMLGVCAPMGGTWNTLRKKFSSNDANVVAAAELELRNFATQGHTISSHFLPPCGKEGPWLVEFKNIMTVSSSEVPGLLKGRFASIAPQFVPNLIQRYAAYLGRIGQPDLDQQTLRNQICAT